MDTLTTPALGLLVEYVLNIGIELVALGQHLVEVMLAEDPAQCRLGELAGRRKVIADLDDRAFGIDHPEINDGTHLDRDVVAGDHVLRRNFIDDNAQIDTHHLLNERHQQKEAGAFRPRVTAECEYDATLVFAQYADGCIDEEQAYYHDDDDGYQ